MTQPSDIVISFPGFGARMKASLEWQANRPLCQAFVDTLPLTTTMLHAMSSGEEMYAPTPIVGKFSVPHRPLTEYQPGSVTLMTDNYKTMDIYYGEISEPLPGPAPIAVVYPTHIPELRRIGREVYCRNYMGHEPVIVKIEVQAGEG